MQSHFLVSIIHKNLFKDQTFDADYCFEIRFEKYEQCFYYFPASSF